MAGWMSWNGYLMAQAFRMAGQMTAGHEPLRQVADPYQLRAVKNP